ncbi:hypothetical protein GCM10022377_22840 [Zhihengliuella alba]|uniref:Uncharacterized protein n=1 Tax=Zhihengliuella alba TaxID=547018 RepID=A0ABP7DSY5_9MICC
MPMNYGPPANSQIDEELRPVRATLLRRIGRGRHIKRASISTAAVAVLSLGGVSVATGFDPDANKVSAEFMTKPQYVDEFAECMEALGWNPIQGSTDPKAPAEVPAVHFTYHESVNVEIGEDAEACRAVLARQLGEPITPED